MCRCMSVSGAFRGVATSLNTVRYICYFSATFLCNCEGGNHFSFRMTTITSEVAYFYIIPISNVNMDLQDHRFCTIIILLQLIQKFRGKRSCQCRIQYIILIMVVIRAINIVPNIISTFPSAFSDLQNCIFFYPVQTQESSTLTKACFQLFCPLYF